MPYSHGALAVAVILASASLVPIVVVAVTRLFSGDRGIRRSSREGYQPPIKRVATDASTLPMMTAVASDQKISDVEDIADERDQLRMADTEQDQPRNL